MLNENFKNLYDDLKLKISNFDDDEKLLFNTIPNNDNICLMRIRFKMMKIQV